MAMTLKFSNLPVEKYQLLVPPLDDIAKVFQKSLRENFEIASAEVVECPDLTTKPFSLTAKGICGGESCVLDIGGPPFLLPLADRNKVYDMKEVARLVGANPTFIFGAGAGPWPYAGTNCEMIANLLVTNGKVASGTRISKMIPSQSDPLLQVLPNNESRFCLLANLFACEGEPGKVIKVHCRKRIGEENFIETLRNALAKEYGKQVVGMGGVFLLKEGTAKQHVMPDFSKIPLHTDQDLENWLNYFEMASPLVALGTFVSCDPGMDLRVQHFHSYSEKEGGHYHRDTTPEIAEYLGYFSPARYLYRIDKPSAREGEKIGYD